MAAKQVDGEPKLIIGLDKGVAVATSRKKRCIDDLSESGERTLQKIAKSISRVQTKPESSDEIASSSQKVEHSAVNENLAGEEKAKVSPKSDADTEREAFDKLTFPERLMYLLQNESEPAALWWQKDGLSFGFEQKLFTEKVLNKLFPIRIKFESFIRKLNRWGFRRVPGQSLPSGGAAYKHPLFQKEKPEIMKEMRFGQKVDLTPRPNHFQRLDAAAQTTSSVKPPHLARQSTADQTLAGDRQAVEDAQRLALLRQIMASNMQAQHGSAFEDSASSTRYPNRPTRLDVSSNSLQAFLRYGLLPGVATPLAAPTPAPILQQGHLLNSGRRLSLQEDVSVLAASLMFQHELRNSLALGSYVDPQRRHSMQFNRTTERTGTTYPGLNNLHASSRPQSGPSERQQVDFPVHHINHAAHTPTTAADQRSLSDQLALLQHQQHQTGDASADIIFLLEQEQLRRQNERSSNR